MVLYRLCEMRQYQWVSPAYSQNKDDLLEILYLPVPVYTRSEKIAIVANHQHNSVLYVHVMRLKRRRIAGSSS
jgi:hypothetical protein